MSAGLDDNRVVRGKRSISGDAATVFYRWLAGVAFGCVALFAPTPTLAVDKTMADRQITYVLGREPYRSVWANTFQNASKEFAWARSPAPSVGPSRHLRVGRKTYLFVYGSHPRDPSLGVNGMFSADGKKLVALISDVGELQKFFGGPTSTERESLLETFRSD